MPSAHDSLNTSDQAGRSTGAARTAHDSLNTSDRVGRAVGIVQEIIGTGIPSAEAFGNVTVTAGPAHAVASGGTVSVSVTPGLARGYGISPTDHVRPIPRSVFVARRPLTGGEWAAVAIMVERITDVAIRDYGVSATEALNVSVIAFIVVSALISYLPRSSLTPPEE